MTWIIILVIFCAPSTFGNIASILDRTTPIGCCGFIRLSHPRLGEVKSPVLPYSRVSRVPAPNPEFFETEDYPRYLNFKPPSFQHKYINTNRLSKFHQSGQPSKLFGTWQNEDEYQDALQRRLHSIRSAPLNSEAELSETDEKPTFTPVISARALSNMREFFEHLQENMEALRKDEDAEVDRNESEENDGVQNDKPGTDTALPSTGRSSVEWKPIASGDLGLKKIRSFFPFIHTQEIRNRLGTNLGLGKRRRR